MEDKFKIKPSVIASLIIFGIHGFSLYCNHDLKTQKTVEQFLIWVVISSSLYYYFLSIVGDFLFKLTIKSKFVRVLDWLILTAQFIGFYYLWDTLDHNKLVLYADVLFGLNCSYIIWDLCHFGYLKKEAWGILLIDLSGFIVSLTFIIVVHNLPDKEKYDAITIQEAMFTGIVGVVIIAQSIGGLIYAIIRLIRLNNEKKITNQTGNV